MHLTDEKKWLGIVLASAAAIAAVAGLLLLPALHRLVHHYRLVEHLESRDHAVRLNAAIELGALGDERAVAPLVAALKAGERFNARPEDETAALCEIGGARTVGLLESALHDPAADRMQIVEALACIDNAGARAVLETALRSGDADLLGIVVPALSESHDKKNVDLLLNVQKHADGRRRVELVGALNNPTGQRLDPRLIEILAAALDDQEADIRIAAAESLAWNYLNGAVPAEALRPVLNNEDADVRKTIVGKLAFYRRAIASDAGANTQNTLSAAVSGDTGQRSRPNASRDAIDKSLAAAAKRASAFLAARQDPAGYWRTAVTPNLRFERPYREMNTYLTPMIVDMLAPVAGEAGLGDNIARARRQIGGEIEDTGLVRYYGRGASDLGQGNTCAISPDADDTALAWRIAPNANSRLLRNALATLHQYRAPNGLYRTWLAPLDSFQCIDRGKNPDPTDVGIQMHILMFLAEASPRDGQDLCAALGKTIADPHIWIYYQREPLIPMIRQAELANSGCPLHLPENRLRTDVAGQEKWTLAGMALSQMLRANGIIPDPSETDDLLRQLAQGNFFAIRRSPPLIYQNDSTGSVPAFYWSQEFGYALWLRIYFENMRRSHLPVAPGKQ